MTKRYAIVRVNYRCPYGLEKCFCKNDNDNNNCAKCKVVENYGDTKEQLIKKIEQAVRKVVKNGVCLYTENNIIYTMDNRFFCEDVARVIVEFLGVEE